MTTIILMRPFLFFTSGRVAQLRSYNAPSCFLIPVWIAIAIAFLHTASLMNNELAMLTHSKTFALYDQSKE